MSTYEQQAVQLRAEDSSNAPPPSTEVGRAVIDLATQADAVQGEHNSESEDDEHPQTKSGVRNSRDIVMQNAKFRAGEWVHMSVIANGSRSKGVFKIYAPVYNPAGWVDYQLIDPYTNQLHNRGAAVRERDLKAGQ